MTDKRGDDSYIAAHEANADLGDVKVLTGEKLLSTNAGAKILNKYESGLKDGLTGLLNKPAWEEEGKRFFDYCVGRGSQFGILYLDVNDFKTFNDAEGHQFGDEILKLVGQAIEESVRETDVAGRVGGDEFAIGLPDVDYETVREVRDRVINRVSGLVDESRIVKIRELRPGVTIGLHVSTVEDDTFKKVVDQADKHMEELKTLNNHGR